MARTRATPRTLSGRRFLVRDFGTSLSIASGTDKLDTTYSPTITTSQSFTISYWAKVPTTASSTEKEIIGFLNGSSEIVVGYAVGAATGQPSLYISSSNGYPNIIFLNASSFDIRDGKWHHWVIVRDVVQDKGFLYIDAVENQQTTDTTSSDIDLGDVPFYLGGRNNNNSSLDRQEAVKVDEFSIFMDIAFTPAQISSLYYSGVYPNGASIYYKLDEGSGTSATDSSGNGLTGVITGATYSADVVSIPRTLPTVRTLV